MKLQKFAQHVIIQLGDSSLPKGAFQVLPSLTCPWPLNSKQCISTTCHHDPVRKFYMTAWHRCA